MKKNVWLEMVSDYFLHRTATFLMSSREKQQRKGRENHFSRVVVVVDDQCDLILELKVANIPLKLVQNATAAVLLKM